MQGPKNGVLYVIEAGTGKGFYIVPSRAHAWTPHRLRHRPRASSAGTSGIDVDCKACVFRKKTVDIDFPKRKVRAPMNHQIHHNFARLAGQFMPVQSCRIVGIAKEDLPALGS
jgi:hypothetical protein